MTIQLLVGSGLVPELCYVFNQGFSSIKFGLNQNFAVSSCSNLIPENKTG